MATKLNPEIEAVIARISHLETRAFSAEEKQDLIEAYRFFKASWIVVGFLRRFVIGLAALLIAASAVLNYFPWGPK